MEEVGELSPHRFHVSEVEEFTAHLDDHGYACIRDACVLTLARSPTLN